MNSSNTVPPGTLLSLFALDEEEAYRNGVVIYQVRLTRTDAGWLAMLKGIKRRGYYVAFIGAEGWHRTLFKLGTACENGHIRWLPDKYPPLSLPKQLALSV